MITYLSHLGITVKNIDETIKKLIKKGAILKFKEKNLINSDAKKLFLSNKQKRHDVGFVKHKDFDFGIELINYKKINLISNKNNLSGILIPKNDWTKLAKSKSINFYTSNLKKDFNLFKEAKFFKTIKINNKSISGKLNTFNGKNIILNLKKIKFINNKLDNSGLNFISFFSTNLKEEIIFFKKKKIKMISKIFSMLINKKKLKIVLFMSHGGIIIELIGK